MSENWVEKFIEKAISEIKGRVYGNVLAAVSGGVDSTTAAVLAKKALGELVHAVFIDTGFMRLNEPQKVKKLLENVLPLEIHDYSKTFYSRLEGLSDAEVKRKTFRQTFYDVLSKLASMKNCKYLVQGTIAPDWIETVGGIKTQHNVLEDIGINTLKTFGFIVIEPLKELYKDQVRKVALKLGIPAEIAYRQPFPGPGLLIRTVGRFTLDKLRVCKLSNAIVEEKFKGLGFSQYFAAVIDDDVMESYTKDNAVIETLRSKATGVKGDIRAYGNIVVVNGEDMRTSISIAENLWGTITGYPNISRVLAQLLESKRGGKYIVSIRAVVTENFMTASVPKIDYELLADVANEILEIDGVSRVCFDVTPKPPATIEYE